MAIEEIEKLLRDAQVKDIFDQISFANRSAALGCLQRIATVPKVMPKLSSALRSVLHALSTAADADRALVNFERFTYKVSNPVAMWEYLHSNPRVIEKLATLFPEANFLPRFYFVTLITWNVGRSTNVLLDQKLQLDF